MRLVTGRKKRARATALGVLGVALCFAGCDPSSLDGYAGKRPVEAGVGPAGDPADSSAIAPGDSGRHPSDGGRETDSGRPLADGGRADSGTTRDAAANVPDAGRCALPHGRLLAGGVPAISSATELPIQDRPASVEFRDGAASGRVDGKPFWLFHDTRLNHTASDGATSRPATGAVGSITSPKVVLEPLDATGAPGPLLSLDGSEGPVFDGDGGSRFYVLWANSVVQSGATALIFYAKIAVLEGFHFDYIGSGVARLAAGATKAVRAPGLLFQASRRARVS